LSLCKNFIEILNSLSPKRVALLCHRNADPDSFGSAYALRELLTKVYADIDVLIVAPEGLNSSSRRLLKHIDSVNVLENIEGNVDVLIMVDAISFIQLGYLSDFVKSSSIPLMVIDHHEPLKETIERALYVASNTNVSSTAEIVTHFFKELHLNISKSSALALLTAILSDSKRFLIASIETFKNVCFLMENGGDYGLALSIISEPMDISERIARLKGAQRLKLFRWGKWLIVFSNVSSFEASLARALIDLGGDLAIVVGGEGDDVRVSARSTEAFYKETGFHLGRDLMIPLGEFIGGTGGGHSTAAGANGCRNRNSIDDFCIKLISSKITKDKS